MVLVDFEDEKVVDLVSVVYLGGNSGCHKNEYYYKGQSQNLKGGSDFSVVVIAVFIGDKQKEDAEKEHS
jgi:hypothetical protein